MTAAEFDRSATDRSVWEKTISFPNASLAFSRSMCVRHVRCLFKCVPWSGTAIRTLAIY